MAIADTYQPTVEKHINWGGVLKGAAIVTGVVVAAAVGYWLFGAIIAQSVTTAVMASPNLSPMAAYASAGAHSVASGLGVAVGTVEGWLSSIPAQLVSMLGLTTPFAPAEAVAVNQTLAIGGAAVTTAIATHAAVPYLQQTHFTSASPAGNPEADLLTTSVPMHDLTHITHHAAEHADEHAAAAWSERITPRAAASASFAENVRASQPERHSPAPAANFIEKLNLDRANLDEALGETTAHNR